MRGTGTLTLDGSHLSGSRLVVSEGADAVRVKSSTLEGSELLVLHGVTTASISASTLRVTGARGVVAEGHGEVKVSRTKLIVAGPGPDAIASLCEVSGPLRSTTRRSPSSTRREAG